MDILNQCDKNNNANVVITTFDADSLCTNKLHGLGR